MIQGFILGVAVAVVTSVATGVWNRYVPRFRARRLWGRRQPDNLTVVVADSGVIDTGAYQRKVTGIGQARAVGLLMPSLTRAYPNPPTDAVMLSSECSPHHREGDIVLLGGPKGNVLTARLFERMRNELPVIVQTKVDEEILWMVDDPLVLPGDSQPPTSTGGKDFGVILRMRNCFDETGTMTLFAGVHTYGTLAAARYFIEHQTEIRRLARNNFAIVVEVIVDTDGQPEQPHRMRLHRWSDGERARP